MNPAPAGLAACRGADGRKKERKSQTKKIKKTAREGTMENTDADYIFFSQYRLEQGDFGVWGSGGRTYVTYARIFTPSAW